MASVVSLVFILLELMVLSLADNISIQYVIIHTSSNASTSSSYSVSSSNQNPNGTPGVSSVSTVSSVEGFGRESVEASDTSESTLAAPSEGTMYYNGARGNEHYFSVSYDHQIPGLPGKDYPIYSQIPVTGFQCSNAQSGYFADVTSGCQVIHICQEDGTLESFLCPNGTIFNQQYLVCDWWFNVDCAKSRDFYNLNVDSSRSQPMITTPLPLLRDQAVSASIQEHTVVYQDAQQSAETQEYLDDDEYQSEYKNDSQEKTKEAS